MRNIKNIHNRKKLAYRLPSYAPYSILFRFLLVSVFAILTLWLIVYTLTDWNEIKHVEAFYYLIIIIAFNIAAELQIILDNILERFFPVPYKLRLRLIIQFIASLSLMGVIHKIVMNILDTSVVDLESRPGVYMGLIIGLFLIYLIAQTLIIMRLTEKHLDIQKEIGDIKQEKLKMDYAALQDQLNPHFLFNNLSVLKSLIIYDKDTAVKFTENFTDVYRYVLQSKEMKLVSLSDELKFIESYIGLHKERLGNGLEVKVSIENDTFQREIAPLTLQLLVENAIKHNIASEETPLLIEISTKDGYIQVKNNIQERESSYSTHTGISNLVRRYEILTEKQLLIEKTECAYLVKTPLL